MIATDVAFLERGGVRASAEHVFRVCIDGLREYLCALPHTFLELHLLSQEVRAKLRTLREGQF
jgi:hypothetical protein